MTNEDIIAELCSTFVASNEPILVDRDVLLNGIVMVRKDDAMICRMLAEWFAKHFDPAAAWAATTCADTIERGVPVSKSDK